MAKNEAGAVSRHRLYFALHAGLSGRVGRQNVDKIFCNVIDCSYLCCESPIHGSSMQENENGTNQPSELTEIEQALAESGNQPDEELGEAPIASNRRIAKNAILLYFRMFISMAVGFYTSRVVLNVLGAEDYGIKSVVGGIIAMMGFLTTSMSGATSRFLTYELGRNDKKRLSETFTSAMIIHVAIALIVFVLAETIGLWFLENKLVIPEHRMVAARWVYQVMILSTMLGITQVPYNATIIAHEKMGVYAYLDILNVTLKLLILYVLVIINYDKLILYSILLLAVNVLMISLYRIYCIRHYKESHLHFVWKPDILKPMLSFSGWDLYGNASNIARNQGVNILVNMFFGLVANAAVSIAFTVQTIVMQFTTGVTVAVRPQIVKSYAVGDNDRMSSLIYMSSKYLYLLLLMVSVPVFMEAHYVLDLWLKNVPPYTVWLVRWMIIFNFFALMSIVQAMGIHATGKVKRISIINGTLYMSVIPFAYFVYKYAGSLYSSFVYNAVTVFIGCLCNVYTLSLSVKQISIKNFFRKVLLPITPITILGFGVAYLPRLFFQEGFVRLVIVGLVSVIVIFSITYFTAEQEVKELIKKRIRRYVRFGKHSDANI